MRAAIRIAAGCLMAASLPIFRAPFAMAATDPAYDVPGGQTQTVSQSIADGPGVVSVSKTGAGTLILTGSNSYSGGTTISAGTLNAGSNSALGSGGVTVQSGAALGVQATIGNTLFLSGNGVVGSGALTEEGPGFGIVSGAVTLSGNAAIGVPNATDTLTVSGPISGAFDLTKAGNGTLSIRGPATYNGDTFVTAGFLSLTGSSLGSGTVVVQSGATLGLAPGVTFSNPIALNGAGGGTSGFNQALNVGFSFFNPLTTLTGPVLLASDTTIVAQSTKFSGVISGDANLTINGPGPTTFAADNTYTGTTTLTGVAYLQIGAGGTTGSIVSPGISMGDNTILIFVRSDTLAYGGAISGGGVIEQDGTGTLILNGSSGSFTGTMRVNSGTLQVGDAGHPNAVVGGNVTVGNGAALLGHGAIAGNVSNSGTVQPGGSIGVLSVGGNYTQAAGGVLTIEISPNVTLGAGIGYSQLRVGGTASLAGSLNVVDDPGSYFVGSRYTIVTASGGRNGTFASVAYNPTMAAYITPILSYDSNNAYLTLDPTPGTAGPPLLFNGGQQVPDALTAMTSAAQGIGDAVLGDVCGAAAQRLVTQGEACTVRPLAAGYQSEVWLHALGGLGSLSGSGARLSFSDDYGGTLIGVGIGRGGFTLGAGGGFLATSLHFSDGGGASQNAGVGFIYGRYVQGPWSMGTMAAYAGGQVDGSRVLAGTGLTAKGNRSGNFAIVQTRAAYDATWHDFTVQPRIGLSFIHAGQAGFAESGASLLDLTYAGTHSDELVGRATLRAMRHFVSGAWQVAPWIEGGVQVIFTGLSRDIMVTDGAFSAGVAGVSPAPTAALLGAGIDLAANDGMDLFLRYQGQLAANQVENAFSAGFAFRF